MSTSDAAPFWPMVRIILRDNIIMVKHGDDGASLYVNVRIGGNRIVVFIS